MEKTWTPTFSLGKKRWVSTFYLLCRQFIGKLCNPSLNASKESPRVLHEDPPDLLIRHSGGFHFGKYLLE